MGRYIVRETTGLSDILIPPLTYSFEIEDTKTGRIGKGAGYTKEEARNNAWKDLKYGEEEPEYKEERSRDNRGNNDPKDEKKGKTVRVGIIRDPGFNCHDNDRSYTTRDKYTGKYPDEPEFKMGGCIWTFLLITAAGNWILLIVILVGGWLGCVRKPDQDDLEIWLIFLIVLSALVVGSGLKIMKKGGEKNKIP